MAKKNLQIHSQNILPIIKKWLYSDRDIFVRELVSNACDALNKIKLLTERGQAKSTEDKFQINITIDKSAKTLTFSDSGIGMDAEEVEKYIAQIAFSSAEEFVEKYQSEKEGNQIIGHFGLGFYSAYMAAEKVEIDTLSYKEGAKPVFWSCDGSSEYTISKGKRKERGTTIILHVGEEGAEFLEEKRLKQVLQQYCTFLTFPIYLGEHHINHKDPLWVKNPSDCTDEDYKEFYRYLYPMDDEPLFWVHLNVDYPFHLQGILYFPKIQQNIDLEKNTVKLYCNRVFVADNCKDVIPNYLMALRGVIDSPDIPLNVSRSALQMDRTVRQLAGHIAKKVADSLTTLHRNENEKFFKCWNDISGVIKVGVLEDPKFYDRIQKILFWKTTEGEWITSEDYLERFKEKTQNKIFYTTDEHQSTQVLTMYRNKGIEVIVANSIADPYLMQQLEQKLQTSFQRLDGGLNDNLIDKERENSLLDGEGKTEAVKLAAFIKQKLGNDQIEVEAKSLSNDTLPGVVVVEEKERRFRDYLRQISPGQESLPHKRTFVVNTNNPIIQAIQKIDSRDASLGEDLVKDLYEMALLSQRELDPKTLNQTIARHQRVLEKLTQQLLETC